MKKNCSSSAWNISCCMLVVIAVCGVVMAEESNSQNEINHDYDTWEAPYDMQKDFPYYISGFDEDFRPIFIGEVGKWPIRRYVERGPETIKTLDKYISQALYRYNQSLSLKSTEDHPVTDGVVLLDMEDFSNLQLASLPTLDLMLKKAREVEIVARRMDKGFFVNVNFIGESLINVLRPILGPSLARTDIYGTNKANWIPKLLRKLPKDQLPEWYGGTKKHTPYKVWG